MLRQSKAFGWIERDCEPEQNHQCIARGSSKEPLVASIFLIPTATTGRFLGDALKAVDSMLAEISYRATVCTPSSLELIFEQGIAFLKSRLTTRPRPTRTGRYSDR